jgi:hypothetical protein
LPDVIKTFSIGVAAVEIPRMYNTISKSIGNSAMVVYNQTNGNAWLVIIPDGNYDVSLTMTESCFDTNVGAINHAIRTATPGELVGDNFKSIDGGQELVESDLVYSVDALTHKSIFTSESGEIDAIRFNVDASGAINSSSIEKFGLGCAIGFRFGERTFDNTLVSEGVAFLSGPSYWFVSIGDTTSTPHSIPFVVAYNGWVSTNDILARVNVAHKSEQRIIHSHLSRPRQYRGSSNIQKIRIKLLDEYGRPVDLNNMDWSVVLEFETVEVGWDCN